jgi:colanic acid/amylovoran biosynthesis glycosyltransferase
MPSEQFILNQMTGLIERGHDVEIFATLPGDDVTRHPDVERYGLLARTHYRFAQPGHRVRRLTKGLARALAHVPAHGALLGRALNIFEHRRSALSLDLLYASMDFLRRPPFDIVHSHFGQAGLFAVRLKQIGAIDGKLVTTFYGCDVSKFLRARGADVYVPLIRHGDLFICITDDMCRRLLSVGFPAARLEKVPVGIDLSRFAMRVRRCRPGEAVRLLTVGRLVEKKGHETSIRAVARVVARHPNLRYRIVGDGPLRSDLERLIRTLGVEHWIQLTGWRTQEEVRAEFDASHVFVLASQTAADGDEEGLPGAIKEANAMGLPVVATRHSGIPEGVLDGTTGFLVPERDVDALADRVQYLIEHPERWEDMGRAGRSLVERQADMERVNDRLVDVYRRVVAARAA